MSRTGARKPTLSYVGSAATSVVDTPMSTTVSDSAALRPWRSANAPSTRPPMGRTRKATPYTASDESSDAVSLSEGKKTLPIVTAKKP
jgi:hypothetical protein